MKTIQPELQVPFSAVPGQQRTLRLVPGDSNEKEKDGATTFWLFTQLNNQTQEYGFTKFTRLTGLTSFTGLDLVICLLYSFIWLTWF